MSASASATSLSWAGLQERLQQQASDQDVCLPGDMDLVNGPPNPKSLLRLFGQSEGDVRVTAYLDDASWCPYSQRVRMLLETKRIPYTITKINMRCYGPKPPEYLAKVPSGLLPAVEIDGQLIIESMDIMRALDATFPDRPMLPAAGDPLADAAKALIRLERDMFGLWCNWCFRAGDADDAQARARFCAGLDMWEGALGGVGGGGPFLLGADVSMLDLLAAPFFERYAASLAYWKGFQLRSNKWPAIDAWFEALEGFPPFAASQSDAYTHVFDIPPQYGPAVPNKDYDRYALTINGREHEAWRLPLSPLTPDSVEPRSHVEEEGSAPRYRLEAAASVLENHEAVTRFALRGAGKKGYDAPTWLQRLFSKRQHYTAPLADPTAEPDLRFEEAMSEALRVVVSGLLTEGGPERDEGEELVARWDADTREAVAVSAAYLRDRIGVPRDMQLPAARQLRAHLNFLIDCIPETS